MKTQVYIQLSNNYIEPDSEETWIEWFCKRKGNEFICEVDKNFIEEMKLPIEEDPLSMMRVQQPPLQEKSATMDPSADLVMLIQAHR
jgi:hypothetical protein